MGLRVLEVLLGLSVSRDCLPAYDSLPITVVSADKDLAEGAAIFKDDFKVPFVDAFAGSLASHENATLVTADYDFKSVPSGTIKVEFLPAK